MQKSINTYKQIEKSTKQTIVSNFTAPQKYYPSPKLSDYDKGIITRYFVIKINDNNMIEINKFQYDNLLNKSKQGIDFNLYKPLSIKWKISGVRNDVYDRNYIIIQYGAEDTNKRTIERIARDFIAIKRYITNMLEFYIDIN